MLQLLTQTVFFGEIHVFFQLSWIHLFGVNIAYLHLKYISCRKYSVKKLSHFTDGNNLQDAPASNTNSCLGVIHVFFQLNCICLFETFVPFSTLKTMIFRKYSFQKVTQFPHRNNVLQAAVSNLDSFLCRDTCVFLTQLNRSIWNKMSLSPPWKFWFPGGLSFKN
jgi:hypothetical protein